MWLLLTAIAPTVDAATFVVDTTTDAVDANPGNGTCATAGNACSLRAAVMEANALAGPDDITLGATTYPLTIPPAAPAMFESPDDNVGDLDIYTDVTVTGVTRDTTIIDGSDITRLFKITDLRDLNNGHVVSSGKLTLMKLTVQNGVGLPTVLAGFGSNGGCIRATAVPTGAGQLSLTDVVVKDCATSTLGGGIFSQVPTALTDVVVSGNVATSTTGEPVGGGLNIGVFAIPATLLRVTITGNTVSNETGAADALGGGLSNGSSDATITDSTISDNVARSARNGEAGAIRNSGTLTLENVTISGNKALNGTGSNNTFGGGIENNGTLVMNGGALTGNCAARDATVCANRVPDVGGNGKGGAIVNFRCNNEGCTVLFPGTVTLNGVLIDQNFAADFGGAIANGDGGTVAIDGSMVVDNDARVGAGILNLGGTGGAGAVSLTASTIDGNVASEFGGGVYNEAGVTISNTTISRNVAGLGDGGGIEACNGTTLTIRNSTVSGNDAGRFGGGMCITRSTADLSFVTIADNSASQGGGIYVGSGTQPVKRLKGVLVADNSATTGPDCAATAALTSLGYNLVENVTACNMAAATGDQLGSAGMPIDPGLGVLQNNGGPTETHEPANMSVAVNVVPEASCTDTLGSAVIRDQRDFVRPAGAQCDVGALERDSVAAPPTATPTATVTPTPTLSATLTSTATPTPSPTATATAGAVAGYHCHGARTSKGTAKFVAIPGVHVVDGFEDVLLEVKKPTALCAPASVNGVPAADDDTHLEQYKLKLAKGEPKHTKRTNLRLDNALGTVFLDTAKQDTLLVPTAKSLTAPPTAPADGVDHYQCYKVKVAKGAPKFPRGLEITVGDQFTAPPARFLVKKPRVLCLPATKNDEAASHAEHQLCYIVKLAKSRCGDAAPVHAGASCKKEEDCGGTKGVTAFCVKQAKFGGVTGAFVANQFGPERLDVRKAADVCVPSTRVL